MHSYSHCKFQLVSQTVLTDDFNWTGEQVSQLNTCDQEFNNFINAFKLEHQQVSASAVFTAGLFDSTLDVRDLEPYFNVTWGNLERKDTGLQSVLGTQKSEYCYWWSYCCFPVGKPSLLLTSLDFPDQFHRQAFPSVWVICQEFIRIINNTDWVCLGQKIHIDYGNACDCTYLWPQNSRGAGRSWIWGQ